MVGLHHVFTVFQSYLTWFLTSRQGYSAPYRLIIPKHVFFSGLTSGVSKRIHCEILIYMYSDLSILKSSIHQYFNQVSLRFKYFCADITSYSNKKHCIMETRLWLKTTTSENQTEGRQISGPVLKSQSYRGSYRMGRDFDLGRRMVTTGSIISHRVGQ